jgi:cytochrome aa3-600 menaquinol oxidase subunit III
MRAGIADLYGTKARRGTLAFLAANAAFFAALLGAYFYLESSTAIWPAPFHFPSLLMAAAMTMFALCASATAAISARVMPAADAEAPVRWLALGISSWLLFMFLEIIEWVRLVYIEQLGPHTPFGQLFLALTGAHWISVGFCVMWLMYVIADMRRRDVIAATLYSHFLNVVWLVFFAVLYMMNADIEGL